MSQIPRLLGKLKSEGDQLFNFFSNLRDSDWNIEIYTEGSIWTVRNVLIHFVTAERAFLTGLFPNVLKGDGGSTQEFSIDRFNARQQERSQNLTPQELLEMFKSTRADMIEWVSKLNEADLEISGRHPYLGLVTLGEMIKTVYVHNLQHYRDIKRVIRH